MSNVLRFRRLICAKTVFLVAVIIFNVFHTNHLHAEKLEKFDFHFDWRIPQLYAGYFVAKDKGFYKDEGFDITLKDGTGALTNMKLIGSKKFLMSTSQAAATIQARAIGIPVVSVAMPQQSPGYVILSLEKSNIKKPEDLKGKKVGLVGGTILVDVFNTFLNKTGVDGNSVERVMTRELTASLLMGKVDAVTANAYSLAVTNELMGRKTNRMPVSDYGVNWYGGNLVAHEDLIKEDPDRIVRFLRATMKGWQYIIDHREEDIASIIMKYRPESDKEYVANGVDVMVDLIQNSDTKKSVLGIQTPEPWENIQEDLFALGVLNKKIDVNTIYTNKLLPKK